MKKLAFILAMTFGFGVFASSCTTVKIVSPPGRTLMLASKNAKCRFIKRRKIFYLYGIAVNQSVFNELFVGVPDPVKVVIKNTWLDNFMSNNMSRDSRGRNSGSVEIKTMDAYTCIER